MLDIRTGDCLSHLQAVPDESVQMCVTSPPYFGLRDYKMEGQLGLEKTPEDYVARMVQVFDEVRRVLKNDGTFWLNIGDSYAGGGKGGNPPESEHQKRKTNRGSLLHAGLHENARLAGVVDRSWQKPPPGLKAKDLIGIPWMLAFALRSAGWYLRQDIIWAKANCMPESVTDRCTKSHEYIFMFSKKPRYYYDHEAIKEPCIYDVDGTGTVARKARASSELKSFPTAERAGIRNGGYKNSVNFNGKNAGNEKQRGRSRRHDGFNDRWDKMEREEQCHGMRNKRDVWTTATASFKGAHFAVFPPKLILPCILAGSRVGDTVLDPFLGSGTTAMVALQNGRKALGIELNPEYVAIAYKRCGVEEDAWLT